MVESHWSTYTEKKLTKLLIIIIRIWEYGFDNKTCEKQEKEDEMKH